MTDLRGYLGTIGAILQVSLAVACGFGGVDGGEEGTSGGSSSAVRAAGESGGEREHRGDRCDFSAQCQSEAGRSGICATLLQ